MQDIYWKNLDHSFMIALVPEIGWFLGNIYFGSDFKVHYTVPILTVSIFG